jgi:predicted DNA-binding protein (UPF0251 family)
MPRHRRPRRIGFAAGPLCFKPCGERGRGLDTLTLRPDELEALRLMDLEGLYQEEAAARLGVSRTTLSRTLARARRTVAAALIGRKRLVLEETPQTGDAPPAQAAKPHG